jgi:hypothetical protein
MSPDFSDVTACCLLNAMFFLGLFFEREDGDGIFHWNIGWLVTDCI